VVHRIFNPPNPWESRYVEWLGTPPEAELEVYEEQARSILAENDSPDVGFRFSLNPYRGCFHGCSYCYARPSHQYLGLGAGTDFERKIIVKKNAPECLRRELARGRSRGETIVFSGNTDCYQPLEAVYGITRRCLEVCLALRTPVAIITKGPLVRRDIDLLASLNRRARASVFVSIPFVDAEMARRLEPSVATPALRFETLRALSEAGVPTGISLAPVIPGLNDSDIPRLLGAARRAGATEAFITLLRLPAEVRPVFFERLRAGFPGRVAKVENAIRDVRQGRLNDPAFGARMRGSGARWRAIEALFEANYRRLGFGGRGDSARSEAGIPPSPVQGLLFEAKDQGASPRKRIE
jgi:DNA repair photolyase